MKQVSLKLAPLRFPLVLFDLGSTLIYFDGVWADWMQSASLALGEFLVSEGYPFSAQVFRETFIPRWREIYAERDASLVEHPTAQTLAVVLAEMGFPDAPPALLRQAMQVFFGVLQPRWHVEADAHACLEALREMGCRLGIVSNAGDDEDVQYLVDSARIRPYFDLILTSAAEGTRKPHPRIFQSALAAWGAAPEQAVMVGDLLGADILGANRLGLRSVWITRRANTPHNLERLGTIVPFASIASLAELPPLVRQWNIPPD